ncbi:hypothetical protein RDI58_010036 [Solanum bulbocastanum]|uniref:Uncharacterized protein n=1 Tax=Solanum bulbocastanum TaxID=147425 RepID=A0AAN8TNG9_SOLBU
MSQALLTLNWPELLGVHQGLLIEEHPKLPILRISNRPGDMDS